MKLERPPLWKQVKSCPGCHGPLTKSQVEHNNPIIHHYYCFGCKQVYLPEELVSYKAQEAKE